jgi:hypothetical protein
MQPRAKVAPFGGPRHSTTLQKIERGADVFRPSGAWRLELRRRAIALLEERRYGELLALLRAARRERPSDLEILKSIRVLEFHLEREPPRAA